MINETLKKEDYAEPRCVLCETPYSKPAKALIPVERILSRYDRLMELKDFAAAEKHLQYWLNEAASLSDKRGEFAVRNEFMGYYRMTGDPESAISQADAAVRLIAEIGLTGTITEGTCLLNSATVYDAAGKIDRSLELFERAKNVYLSVLPEGDSRLAGLYNNYGIALHGAERYSEAIACFGNALQCASDSPRGKLEQAITKLNIADVYNDFLPPEEAEYKIGICLDEALCLLYSPDIPGDGYCAFVYEKCAPVFRYYGRFADANDLKNKSKGIYENIRNM